MLHFVSDLAPRFPFFLCAGEIPKTLENLTRLEQLDLEQNRLVGKQANPFARCCRYSALILSPVEDVQFPPMVVPSTPSYFQGFS